MGNTASSKQSRGIQHVWLLLNPEYFVLSHGEIRLAFSFGDDLFFYFHLEFFFFWDMNLKQSDQNVNNSSPSLLLSPLCKYRFYLCLCQSPGAL